MKIFRLKKSNGQAYGSYRLYLPASGGRKAKTMTLDTLDENEAKRKAKQILEDQCGTQSNQSTPLTPSTPTIVPTITTPIDPRELLGEWSSGQAPVAVGVGTAPTAGTVADTSVVNSGTATSTDKSSEQPKSSSKKAYKALAGVAARVNVAAVGLTVKAFGRIPTEPDESDVKELGGAWQDQLEIWLQDVTMAPWVTIVGISAAMGMGMYIQGEPVPQKKLPMKQEAPGQPTVVIPTDQSKL